MGSPGRTRAGGEAVMVLAELCMRVSVLGLARTGLIFTGLQEGAQPGGGG